MDADTMPLLTIHGAALHAMAEGKPEDAAHITAILARRLRESESAGERGRQQIARLTEALRFYADPVSYENETPRHVRPVITDQGARARAVLADEEDAAND